MKTQISIFLFAAAALSFQACTNERRTDTTTDSVEQAEGKDTLDSDISDFAMKAASGGMMEVELGNIAQQRALNPRVKAFGAMMVEDHSKANDELKALATTKNIALPDSLSDEHKRHVDEMKKMQGADFDKHYMEMMVDDHNDDIDLFEDASKEDDADIKAFASKTLPVLRKHLDSAKVINDLVKKK